MNTDVDNSQKAPVQAETAAFAMDLWTTSFSEVLESMTQHRPTLDSRQATATALHDGLTWWAQNVSLVGEPSFWIGMPSASVEGLGRLTLSALGVDEPSDDDLQSTCRDLLAQASAVVASKLGGKLGRQITGGDSVAGAAPTLDKSLVFTWMVDAGLVSIEGVAVWSTTLLGCLANLTEQPTPPLTTPLSGVTSDTPAAIFGSRNFDSMPKLDLMVRFVLGRANLRLRDVFRLNVGSVIELDRTVTEPAEVVVSGRVLARGQVVVINGNYGLKILPHE